MHSLFGYGQEREGKREWREERREGKALIGFFTVFDCINITSLHHTEIPLETLSHVS